MKRSKTLLLCALMGCAGPTAETQPTTAATAQPEQAARPVPAEAKPAQAQAAAPQPINVSMVVEAVKRDGQDIVDPGETLHSGDRLALRVEVDQPAYVYVMYADPKGAVNRLFPTAGDVKIEPGRYTRVPPVGQWMKLDRETGTENLFVVARAEPLSEAALVERVQEDLKSAPPKRGKAKTRYKRKAVAAKTGGEDLPPPSLLDEVNTRGIAIDQGMKPQVDKNGAAVLRFSFDHK